MLGKVFDFEVLPTILHSLKKQGHEIVFTHGTFDLFHVSHLDLLIKSSKEGSVLVVGVDSDESVKNYKGVVRPIVNEKHRASIIGALNVVDFCFVKALKWQSIDMLKELYKELSVDTTTYGTTFSAKEEIADAAGTSNVRLKSIETIQLESTTSIIDRVVKGYYKANRVPVVAPLNLPKLENRPH